MITYYDPLQQRPAIKVLPGEYALAREHEVLVTVLGSCVAACLRDEVAGICGMNHFMLPASNDPFTDRARYGVHAMELLVNELLQAGARRERLTAKVFGGGAVLGNMPTLQIGKANSEFVREFLHVEGIRLLAQDLRGNLPRKIYFYADTGAVRVKYLRALTNDTIAARETEYASALQRLPRNEPEMFQ